MVPDLTVFYFFLVSFWRFFFRVVIEKKSAAEVCNGEDRTHSRAMSAQARGGGRVHSLLSMREPKWESRSPAPEG